jgi:hypothetical protein
MVEAVANVLIGYCVACLSNLIILPMFGYNVGLSESMEIGLWFTAVSLARSYGLRRFYNWYHGSKKK